MYTVKRGDALFYKAWMTGNDIHTLAQNNKIRMPFNLKKGQVLKSNIKYNFQKITNVNDNFLSNKKTKDRFFSIHSPKFSHLLSSQLLFFEKANTKVQSQYSITSFSEFKKNADKIIWIGIWRWPINGKIINNFSIIQGGNQGIDIAGFFGQPIIATASGRVVYVGNALHGYGNLIIIKHNNYYLSTYAHNNKIFVRENQKVQAGQKIATMGKTETNSVRLHFEIRYKGKSVNPLRYLPQR